MIETGVGFESRKIGSETGTTTTTTTTTTTAGKIETEAEPAKKIRVPFVLEEVVFREKQ